MGEILKDASETLVVLDDQEHAPLARQLFDDRPRLVPIRLTVAAGAGDGCGDSRANVAAGVAEPAPLAAARSLRSKVSGMRTVNVLPSTLGASERERSAEQTDKFSADRQSEAGAAVFAADRSVRLPEGFKNGLLFVLGNADACVRDG